MAKKKQTSGLSIESQISWKKFDSKILDTHQNIIFEMKNIEAPTWWSQTAVDIAASKYFFKGRETSVRQLVLRIASGLKTALIQSQIYKTKKEVDEAIDQLKWGLYQQHFAFNSPVWFNCGLSESYKAESEGSQHYAYNFKNKKIEFVSDTYKRPQASACFIQSIDDSMESIFDLLKTEAMLFKYGSGTGTNFTNLRSKYESLKSGGQSSGLISFLEIFDKSAGSIKSGGVTRRAAKMVCLDVDHPEILEFIDWKKNEEIKAKTLIDAGYSSALDGEVYRTISGQNSNNSIRLTDRFMKAVLNDEEWSLKFSSNGKLFKKIKAKEIWNKLCESAWACADPGVQFHDTINQFNVCSSSDEIKASNPCSEFMFLDNTACNLASLNLIHFYKEQFQIFEFNKQVDLVFKTQEALVDYASYPTKQIAENSHRFRPIGLGFANLGSLLMVMGIPYDSNQARAWAGYIAANMAGQSYLTSGQLAEKNGAFAEYKKNKKSAFSVIKKQMAALNKIDWSFFTAEEKKQTYNLWKKALVQIQKHGLRNAQVTVIAPTGTIGLVMDCGTTGIEPDYSLIKYKKLSGGGTLKIVNPSTERALQNLNYANADREQILNYILEHGTVVGSPALKKSDYTIFQTAQGDNCIIAEGHLKMMAAVQPFISGAISKTVNLPSSAEVQDISEVYMSAWKLGLKSVSLYRDQSKFTQPLSALNPKSNIGDSQNMACLVCGKITVLESGCYKCMNCGFTSACVG